jgi:hypothetical protein
LITGLKRKRRKKIPSFGLACASFLEHNQDFLLALRALYLNTGRSFQNMIAGNALS